MDETTLIRGQSGTRYSSCRTSNLGRQLFFGNRLEVCVQGDGIHPSGWLFEELSTWDSLPALKTDAKRATDREKLQEAFSPIVRSQVGRIAFVCASSTSEDYKKLKQKTVRVVPPSRDLASDGMLIEVPCTLERRAAFDQLLEAFRAIRSGTLNPSDWARNRLDCQTASLSSECQELIRWVETLVSFRTSATATPREHQIRGVCLSNRSLEFAPPARSEVLFGEEALFAEFIARIDAGEKFEALRDDPRWSCWKRATPCTDPEYDANYAQRMRLLERLGCQHTEDGRLLCASQVSELRSSAATAVVRDVSYKTYQQEGGAVDPADAKRFEKESPGSWRLALQTLSKMRWPAEVPISAYAEDRYCGNVSHCRHFQKIIQKLASQSGEGKCFKLDLKSPVGEVRAIAAPLSECAPAE